MMSTGDIKESGRRARSHARPTLRHCSANIAKASYQTFRFSTKRCSSPCRCCVCVNVVIVLFLKGFELFYIWSHTSISCYLCALTLFEEGDNLRFSGGEGFRFCFFFFCNFFMEFKKKALHTDPQLAKKLFIIVFQAIYDDLERQ